MHFGNTAAAQEAEGRRRDDDERKGQAQDIERQKGQCRDDPVGPRLQCPPGNPEQRFDHDGENGRLDAVEDGLRQRQIAEMRIEHGEGQNDQRPRKDEQ